MLARLMFCSFRNIADRKRRMNFVGCQILAGRGLSGGCGVQIFHLTRVINSYNMCNKCAIDLQSVIHKDIWAG